MGLIGATALGLAAPAPAEEIPYDFTVDVGELSVPQGATLDTYASLTVTGDPAMAGYSADLTVPDGASITGLAGGEILDGTERPDEGCALVTPQRLECHTNATLEYPGNADTWFKVTADEDATVGVLGAITYTVTPDDGAPQTAEANLTVTEGEVELEVAFDPLIGIRAAPGADFEHTVHIQNVGNKPMKGASIDFQPGEGVTVTGVTATGLTGLDLVDGAARPDEGCAVAGTRVECHTNATLDVSARAEVTFHMRMPESAQSTGLGDTSVVVTGDNGGKGSDVTDVGLDVDPRMLDVTATPAVEGAAGDVVEIVVTARNHGVVPVVDRFAELVVPAGATIVGVEGFELAEESTWPEEGCALLTPQQVSCFFWEDALQPGTSEERTIQIRLDDDAPAGELGVASLHYEGYAEDYEAETVVTVTGGSGDETGGDGEELPNTGTDSTTVALTAFGLVLAGAVAMALRARRS